MSINWWCPSLPWILYIFINEMDWHRHYHKEISDIIPQCNELRIILYFIWRIRVNAKESYYDLSLGTYKTIFTYSTSISKIRLHAVVFWVYTASHNTACVNFDYSYVPKTFSSVITPYQNKMLLLYDPWNWSVVK